MSVVDVPSAWSESPDVIRRRFLDYFAARGHQVLPSASLVPENDPTLLFIGAGMAPFKDHFLGRVPLEFRRATTSQKCLRTGDLDNVGRTPAHHTFFEMLGNFSFGDYFKDDAIAWAWEFLTVEMGIPAARLRVSVYRDDAEAAEAWSRIAGIARERIAFLGPKSNFWPANAPEDGPDGPCGPCSEIFFDLGFRPSSGDGGPQACTIAGCPEAPESVDCDCRRLIEIWNLVFQQFDRRGANALAPLGMRNIDTGMGLERLLMVLAHLKQGAEARRSGNEVPPAERVFSNFQSPLFTPLVEEVLRATGASTERTPEDVVRARRVADHARAATFCVADGVRPSNEGRGYVLRRVVRRAVRDGIRLGANSPFLHALVPAVVAAMGRHYGALSDGAASIAGVLRAEEERFRLTYEQGVTRLLALIEGRAPGSSLSGADAFLLHDTFGFPVDVTEDVLREHGLTLDRAGFDAAMDEARERSRQGTRMSQDIFAAGPLARLKQRSTGTVFLGYGPEPETAEGGYRWNPGDHAASVVEEILVEQAPVDRVATAGVEAAIILRETPFYAEQGGQVGDTGVLTTASGAVFRVKDTRKVEEFHLHVGTLESGSLSVGDAVDAQVDSQRRDAIRRNHTGTHLLHRVLRQVLGDEARQAGSLVAPDALRFDFSFPRGLTPEERERIESEVNARIYANEPVETRVLDVEAARGTGAVSMFGEKYGSRVRVLTAGDSREFCGGTHCRATGDIGSFRVLSERSVASGVRRIEAVTGERAVHLFQEDRRTLARMAAEVERLKKEVVRASRAAPAAASATKAVLADPLVAPRNADGAVTYIVIEAAGAEEKELLASADRVKADAGPPLAVLFHAAGKEGVALVAVGNGAAVKAGFHAGNAVRAAATLCGGGGGGRPDLARGKGPRAAPHEELEAAFGVRIPMAFGVKQLGKHRHRGQPI
jgi:alanyl-tRNA synthetase